MASTGSGSVRDREPKASQPAGALPGEHVGDGVVVEESVSLEEPEQAALERAPKLVDVLRKRCVASWKVTLPRRVAQAAV